MAFRVIIVALCIEPLFRTSVLICLFLGGSCPCCLASYISEASLAPSGQRMKTEGTLGVAGKT